MRKVSLQRLQNDTSVETGADPPSLAPSISSGGMMNPGRWLQGVGFYGLVSTCELVTERVERHGKTELIRIFRIDIEPGWFRCYGKRTRCCTEAATEMNRPLNQLTARYNPVSVDELHGYLAVKSKQLVSHTNGTANQITVVHTAMGHASSL